MESLKTVLCQAAFAIVILAASAPSATAGPIRGYVYPDGRVSFTNFNGEIFAALRGPDSLLNRANGQSNGYVIDVNNPGEIAYLGLSGIVGDLHLGLVIKPAAPIADYAQLKMAYQVSFTSQMIEVPFTVVGNVDPTKDSFTAVPEPTAAVLALGMGVALVSRRERRRASSGHDSR